MSVNPVRGATIHILDDSTVNQIAAGEVVERAASVVKELIENAIDADARHIRIEITSASGSITRIRVTDDGSGMSAADAVMAFTPHATSKIQGIGDLEQCMTLGFRGEALPSIAAVSEVTLVTKPRGSADLAGTKVAIRGGSIAGICETGAAEGTTVNVDDLFYNTPARRKFQKSLPVELAYIASIVEGEALAHPAIAFSMLHNKKKRISTQGTTDLADTIVDLYGIEVAKGLIQLRASTPRFQLEGHLSQPELFRQSRDHMFISINQRFIHHLPLIRAIRDGYGALLPRDQFPLVFLNLSIDPALVDVNIHPTKREVRLSYEKEILPSISKIVREALLEHIRIPEQQVEPAGQARLLLQEEERPAYSYIPEPPGEVHELSHPDSLATERQLRRTEQTGARGIERNRLPEMEVIGQIGAAYIVAGTSAGDLVLIDQHAAHERILYDQITETPREGVRSQELLVPAILHLSPREAAILDAACSLLKEEGFEIEAFGRNTYAIRAVPIILGGMEDPSAVHGVIRDLLSEEGLKSLNSREAVSRVIACRGALKAGTVCTEDQCSRLIQQLLHTRNPYTCPHGRPTIISIPKGKLDAMFKRT